MPILLRPGHIMALVTALLLSVAFQPLHADPREFEHLYGRLLMSYWRPTVTIHGIKTTVFDYERMTDDSKVPGSLFERALTAIEHVEPEQLIDPDQSKAFWINAYNFAAMRLVVDHYPADSIRSLSISLIKYPWSKTAIRIGRERYSLKQIEKDILLKQFDDPRIVFAVSCAAVSCPDRVPYPFTAQQVDEQLDAMIKHFFSNPDKGSRLDRNARVLTLSWILSKDKHLFETEDRATLDFVLPYLDSDVREWLKANPVRIEYFEHDWTLNDLAQAD